MRVPNRFLFLAVTSLCLILTSTVPAAVSGDYQYTDNLDGTCTITNYTGPGGDITIPDTLNGLTVITIGYHAFYGNSSLTSITIPNTVTSIGDYAFGHCSSVTDIIIGTGVISIGISPFYNFSSLLAITVDSNNIAYSSIDGVLFNKIQTMLIKYPQGKNGGYTIPNSVDSIGNYAFANCTGLSSINISDAVTLIGNYVFDNCINLTTVNIGDRVAVVGDCAFYNCNAMLGITIPDSVTSIGASAFAYCGALTGIDIPDNVTSIGDSAFSECHDLIDITIGINVNSIGGQAFEGCYNMIAITVDANNSFYSSIDGILFDYSQNVIIKCPEGKDGDYAILDSVNAIGSRAFYGCSNLNSISIPDSVTAIGDFAFEYCNGFKNIFIPDSVTSIGYGAFESCNNLISVVISDSVSFIENRTFRFCSDLTCVTVGKNVTAIGNYTFQYCRSLTEVYFKGDVPELGLSAFNNVTATVYYLPGTAGWESTFGGLPTAPWPLSMADVDENGDVNLWDFATFAAAWQTRNGEDAEYNPLCDISDPVDEVINAADLQVFVDNWLITPCQ